jgi:hypothetical protein
MRNKTQIHNGPVADKDHGGTLLQKEVLQHHTRVAPMLQKLFEKDW